MNSFTEAGQLLSDRYRLTSPFPEQLPYDGVRVWNAIDTLLGTSLRLITLDPAAPTTSEALDAARRSSLIDDPHVVRILSVGQDPSAAFIATEIPLGTPVSEFLHGTPFPPSQAHALMGEIASALNSARSRGVRHLRLGARQVRVGVLGEVFIDGLGVDAALAGLHTDSVETAEADRLEARGLTLLLAQLLTGRTDGEPRAILGDVAENADLPEQIRNVCARELNGVGALSPSDFVREIAPWGAISREEFPPAGSKTADGAPPEQRGASPGGATASENPPVAAGAGAGPAGFGWNPAGMGRRPKKVDPLSEEAIVPSGMNPNWVGLDQFAEEHPEAVDPSATAIFRMEDLEADALAYGDPGDTDSHDPGDPVPPQEPHRAGSPDRADVSSDPPTDDGSRDLDATRHAIPAVVVGGSSDAAEGPAPGSGEPRRPDGRVDAGISPDGPDAADAIGAIAASSDDAHGSGPDSGGVAGARGEATGAAPVGGSTSDREDPLLATRIAPAPAQMPPTVPPPTVPTTGTSPTGTVPPPGRGLPSGDSSSGRQAGESESESKPVAPTDQNGEKLYDTSKVVLIGAGVLVAIAALWSSLTFFSPPSVSDSKPSRTASATPSARPSGSDKTEPTDKKTEKEKLEAPGQVESVTLLNPQAAALDPSSVDQQDSPQTVKNVVDGNASTSWRSWWYTNPNFVGKQGIGLEIKLPQKAKVSSVEIRSNAEGGNVQWRDTAAAAPNAGDVAAEGAMSSSTVLEAKKPIATDTIVLWFNQLPKDKAGQYRIDIAEIVVK